MPVPTERHPADRVVIWPDERLQTVLEVIRGAERRLRLSIFKCNEPRVFRALAEARRRGVDIETIVTSRTGERKRKLRRLRKKLDRIGVVVHESRNPGAKYHAKYVVADSRVALIGSLNFTRKCFERSCDFLLQTTARDLVAGVERLFEFDTRPGRATFPDLSPRLVAAPDGARRRISDLLQSARHRIALIDPKLTDPEMIAILRTKILQGVQVEVLGHDDVGVMASHGKLLIVDDRVAMIGSLSLSPAGLDHRRELAALLTDPGAIAELNQFFRTVSEAVPAAAPELDVAYC